MMKTLVNILHIFMVLLFLSCTNSSNELDVNPPDNNNPPTYDNAYDINIISDNFEGENFIVVGSEGWNFMVAFENNLEGRTLELNTINGELPLILVDSDGNKYDIFGKVIEGPDMGKQLVPMNSFIGYWFSWGTFYPGLEIFDNTLPIPNAGASVTGTDEWLIPRDKVFVGALRDAIPSIDTPEFGSYSNDPKNTLTEDITVIGVRLNGENRAYPQSILNWHEIVNDKIGDTYYSVIFCPLTGTSTVWNRKINGEITTFGVSGFLYNSNIVPYDRNSNSNWSQMLQKSVQGTLSATKSTNLFFLETSLETWRTINSSYQLLSNNTGYNRNYSINPYGNYPTNSTINFPINFADDRLHPKERVLGIIVNEKAKAYRFQSFR